jgi:hypothetical protein
VRPEPSGGPIFHVRLPDTDFRRAKATFRLIHEDPKPLPQKPDPGDPSDLRGRPGSSCAFSGDFSGGIGGFLWWICYEKSLG